MGLLRVQVTFVRSTSLGLIKVGDAARARGLHRLDQM